MVSRRGLAGQPPLRPGPSPVWTERAAFGDAVVAALLLAVVFLQGLSTSSGGRRGVPWWITGRLGVGQDSVPRTPSSAD